MESKDKEIKFGGKGKRKLEELAREMGRELGLAAVTWGTLEALMRQSGTFKENRSKQGRCN